MIIVTGASRGLGRAICERLMSNGIEPFGIARSFDTVPFDNACADVSSYDDLKSIAKDLRKRKVKIDGLINAAGIASMNLAVLTPKHVTQNIVNTNLLGTIYSCQVFSPLMIRHRKGAIINFSTIAVALGLKGESVYAASKAGVEGFTKAFAREMSDFDIRTNCIAPGPIDTSLLKGITREQIGNIVRQQIIPKQFTPDAVCDLVDILLDDKSSSISGQTLNIGGV
jgi:3-oxoacyl-[acyl-carrier protein] reductase